MASLLVNITSGPEHPTRAALGLLVARTALAEGHDVTVFLAGDGVQLIRDAVLGSVNGVGTGSAREHFDAIVSAGGSFYLSKMSCAARGITDADVEGKPAQLALPPELVQKIVDSDRTVTY